MHLLYSHNKTSHPVSRWVCDVGNSVRFIILTYSVFPKLHVIQCLHAHKVLIRLEICIKSVFLHEFNDRGCKIIYSNLLFLYSEQSYIHPLSDFECCFSCFMWIMSEIFCLWIRETEPLQNTKHFSCMTFSVNICYKVAFLFSTNFSVRYYTLRSKYNPWY